MRLTASHTTSPLALDRSICSAIDAGCDHPHSGCAEETLWQWVGRTGLHRPFRQIRLTAQTRLDVDNRTLNESSPYFGKRIVMATKHAKSIAVPHRIPRHPRGDCGRCARLILMSLVRFRKKLSAKEVHLIAPAGNVKWGIDLLNAEFGIASEGALAHIPTRPLSSRIKILHFIDRTRNFHLHVSRLCSKNKLPNADR